MSAARLVHTPRHIAGRALLAGMRGRLWYCRLSTPVLEQLRREALQAAHGRKDADVTLLACLRVMREAEETLSRRAKLDAEDATKLARTAVHDDGAPMPWCDACQSWHHPENPTCRKRRGDDLRGGTRVPLPPPPPRPLSPARLPEPEGAL